MEGAHEYQQYIVECGVCLRTGQNVWIFWEEGDYFQLGNQGSFLKRRH